MNVEKKNLEGKDRGLIEDTTELYVFHPEVLVTQYRD